jgi:hypothetical protein
MCQNLLADKIKFDFKMISPSNKVLTDSRLKHSARTAQ